MRYPRFPGTGERIKERLLALGYVTPEGKPDIARFIKTHHYDARSFYPWTKGRTPAGENLERLVLDLRCSPAWLLFGQEVAHPIAGGSTDDGTPLLVNYAEYLSLVGLWLRGILRAWASPLHYRWASA